ncbi:cation chloride cotransporter [Aspergillus luchuensis]|uniref:Cation chloride cotransporter n=1 Tax=Aspergillus kawachii TaxID=1069201 RepID=A0A146F689_ASPKA|nr:cation chloride cotransporter [Aspergillus luchuensis]
MDHVALFPIYYRAIGYARSRSKAGNRQGSKETLKQKWLVEKPGKPEHIVEHRAVYIALRRIVSTVPSWPTFKKLVCTDHFGTGKLN